jgi:hypothetical protein
MHLTKSRDQIQGTPHGLREARWVEIGSRKSWKALDATVYDSDEASRIYTPQTSSDNNTDNAELIFPTPESITSGSVVARYLLQEEPGPLPFSSIPIDSTSHITGAFKFFKHGYLPVVLKLQLSSLNASFRTCCQVILQDAMVFEQMMAYFLVLRNMNPPPNERLTASTLYHSNRSVSLLRQSYKILARRMASAML